MSPILSYSRKYWRGVKFWQFGGLHHNRQIKIHQNFLLAYNNIIIRMVIPYGTTKFKSANNIILAIAIWAQPPNLIPANSPKSIIIIGLTL